MILKDWNDYELGEIVEIKKEKYNPKKEEIDYPCIELEHINQVIGTINGYTSSIQQSSIKNKFCKGDVLYGKLRPYLRKYYLCKFDGVCSSEIWVFNGKKVTNEYLFYFIQDDRFNNIANVSTGSKMPRADWNFMKEYAFRIPEIEEQYRIVKVLSTWDLAIEKQEQLIEKKKEFKKGLMQRLLSGEVRFKEFNDEWREYKFSQLLKEVKRNIIFEDDKLYDLISVRRRSGGLFHRESLMGKEIKTKKLKSVEIGDFLISKMQIVHGAAGLVTKAFKDMYISDSYIALIPKDNRSLDVEYLNYISKTLRFYNQTFRSSYGVHIEKMTFNLELFMNEKIKLPNIEEQRKISEVLKLADKEIELLEKELEALKLQKKGLMQRLLTGEVRVKV